MRVLLIVVAAVSTGCATTGATPQPFPTSGRPPASAVPGGGAGEPGVVATGYAVSGTALSYRGVPYRLGGADPNGFDCSGLVWYVYTQHGVAMPRTVEEQYRVGETVAASRLEAGDLVFFSTTSRGASHVGIMIGGDSFVHAPASNGVVRVEHLGSSYWSQRYLGARRLF